LGNQRCVDQSLDRWAKIVNVGRCRFRHRNCSGDNRRGELFMFGKARGNRFVYTSAASDLNKMAALRPRWIVEIQDDVEAPDVRVVQRIDPVGQPEAGDRILFQHAVGPALVPRAVPKHRGQSVGCTEQVFDFVHHQ